MESQTWQILFNKNEYGLVPTILFKKYMLSINRRICSNLQTQNHNICFNRRNKIASKISIYVSVEN